LWALASTPFYRPFLAPDLDPVPLTYGEGEVDADVSPLLLRRSLIRAAALRAAKLYLLYGYGRDEVSPVGVASPAAAPVISSGAAAAPSSDRDTAATASSSASPTPAEILSRGVATVAGTGAGLGSSTSAGTGVVTVTPHGFPAAPVHVTANDRWNGLAATAVDALDTLMLMQTTALGPDEDDDTHIGVCLDTPSSSDVADDCGSVQPLTGAKLPSQQRSSVTRTSSSQALDLPALFRPIIAALDFAAPNKVISYFEMGIRILGGLLSAHDISGDPLYLSQAYALARRMEAGFFGTVQGVQRHALHLASGASENPGWTGHASILAEVGTIQIELAALAGFLANAYGAAQQNGVRNTSAAASTVDPASAVAAAQRRAAALLWSPARNVFSQLARYKPRLNNAVEVWERSPICNSTANASTTDTCARVKTVDATVAAVLAHAGAAQAAAVRLRGALSGAGGGVSHVLGRAMGAISASATGLLESALKASSLASRAGSATEAVAESMGAAADATSVPANTKGGSFGAIALLSPVAGLDPTDPAFWRALASETTNAGDWTLAHALTPSMLDPHYWSLAKTPASAAPPVPASAVARALESDIAALGTAAPTGASAAAAAAAVLLDGINPLTRAPLRAGTGALPARRRARAQGAAADDWLAPALAVAAAVGSNQTAVDVASEVAVAASSSPEDHGDIVRTLAASRLATVTTALAELAKGAKLYLSPWAAVVRELSGADTDGVSTSTVTPHKAIGPPHATMTAKKNRMGVATALRGAGYTSLADTVTHAATGAQAAVVSATVAASVAASSVIFAAASADAARAGPGASTGASSRAAPSSMPMRTAGIATVYVEVSRSHHANDGFVAPPRRGSRAAAEAAAALTPGSAAAPFDALGAATDLGLGSHMSARALSPMSAAAVVARAMSAPEKAVADAIGRVLNTYGDPYVNPMSSTAAAAGEPVEGDWSDTRFDAGLTMPSKADRARLIAKDIATVTARVAAEVEGTVQAPEASTETKPLPEKNAASAEEQARQRRVEDLLRHIRAPPALPLLQPRAHTRISMGSLSDSYFEYLLKLYLLSGGRDVLALDMYLDAIEFVEREMIAVRNVKIPKKTADAIGVTHLGELVREARPTSAGNGTAGNSDIEHDQVVIVPVAFVGDLSSPPGTSAPFAGTMEHLTCFFGGLLALGAWTGTTGGGAHSMEHMHMYAGGKAGGFNARFSRPLPPSAPLLRLRLAAPRHMILATQVTNLCYLSYALSATGLGPETIVMLSPYAPEPAYNKAKGGAAGSAEADREPGANGVAFGTGGDSTPAGYSENAGKGGGQRARRVGSYDDSPRDGWDDSESREAVADILKRHAVAAAATQASAAAEEARFSAPGTAEPAPADRARFVSEAATGATDAAFSPAALGFWPFSAAYFSSSGATSSECPGGYCYHYGATGPAPGFSARAQYSHLHTNPPPAAGTHATPAVYPYLPGAGGGARGGGNWDAKLGQAPAEHLSVRARYAEFACGRFCGHLPRSTYPRWAALRQLENHEDFLDTLDVQGQALASEALQLGSFLAANATTATKPSNTEAAAERVRDVRSRGGLSGSLSSGLWDPAVVFAPTAPAALVAAARAWQRLAYGGLKSVPNAAGAVVDSATQLSAFARSLPRILPASLPRSLLAALGRGPPVPGLRRSHPLSPAPLLSSDPSQWPWPTSVGSVHSLVSSARRLSAMSSLFEPAPTSVQVPTLPANVPAAALPPQSFSFASLPDARALFPRHTPDLYLFQRDALSGGSLPRCPVTAGPLPATGGSRCPPDAAGAAVSARAGTGLRTGRSASGHRWRAATPAATLRMPPSYAPQLRAVPTAAPADPLHGALAAARRARTTYLSHARTPWTFAPTGPWAAFFKSGERKYVLRPETAESIYVMYRVTGDERYRKMGWNIFQAIEGHCRTRYGYSAVRDVEASVGSTTAPAEAATGPESSAHEAAAPVRAGAGNAIPAPAAAHARFSGASRSRVLRGAAASAASAPALVPGGEALITRLQTEAVTAALADPTLRAGLTIGGGAAGGNSTLEGAMATAAAAFAAAHPAGAVLFDAELSAPARLWARDTVPLAASADAASGSAATGLGFGADGAAKTSAGAQGSPWRRGERWGGVYLPPAHVTALGRVYSPQAIASNWENSQESFFFAETLKYLYLLHSAVDDVPMERFVFNTEAHPVGIVTGLRAGGAGGQDARQNTNSAKVKLPRAWEDAIDAARSAAAEDAATKHARQTDIAAKLRNLGRRTATDATESSGSADHTDSILSFGRGDLLHMLWGDGEDERARVFWHRVLSESTSASPKK
jgi:hypothetical protein